MNISAGSILAICIILIISAGFITLIIKLDDSTRIKRILSSVFFIVICLYLFKLFLDPGFLPSIAEWWHIKIRYSLISWFQ